MQFKKVFIGLIVFLASCSPVITLPTATPEAPTSTQVLEELRATVPDFEPAAVVQPVRTKTPAPLCAKVTVDEALHLRQDPDPHAFVLAFMERGEVVKLLSSANADWWLIEREGVRGYARSKYLEKGACGKDESK